MISKLSYVPLLSAPRVLHLSLHPPWSIFPKVLKGTECLTFGGLLDGVQGMFAEFIKDGKAQEYGLWVKSTFYN